MNDDELRAFLDSATVGDDDDQGQGADTSASESPGKPPATEPPRRGVPSFDELMNLGAPASDAGTGVAPAPVATPAPPAPAHPAPAATPASVAEEKPAERSWAPAYAKDDEQLVPLILPGFSPEPRERKDLPPVFQAEPTAPQKPVTHAPADPAPTQPFDVLTDKQPAQTQQAAARQSEPADDTDPFAMLAPELLNENSDDHDAAPDYERISVTGSENRSRKALPWIIVGGGVAVAIIASIFVINGVRGSESSAPTATPETTTQPTAEATTEPSEEPSPSEEPVPAPDTVPVVDPGSTWQLPIEQWGLTVQVSEKLGGSTPYTLFDGNSRAMFDSIPVASGFSPACAAAREPNVWGLLKKEDGTLEVVRPEPRCTSQADAALYDTIWGTLDYMAKSAKPS